MATVKYQITMTVEVNEEANPTIMNEGSLIGYAHAKMGNKKLDDGVVVNKVEATKIGATGVTPKVISSPSYQGTHRRVTDEEIDLINQGNLVRDNEDPDAEPYEI